MHEKDETLYSYNHEEQRLLIVLGVVEAKRVDNKK